MGENISWPELGSGNGNRILQIKNRIYLAAIECGIEKGVTHCLGSNESVESITVYLICWKRNMSGQFWTCGVGLWSAV